MPRYIVLVDDEEGILKALKRELGSFARERDVEVQTFTSGEDALRFLAREHLDVILVVSDQRMPGIKGHEFLATCGQRYPEIMLLMLTGYTDIQDITQAIRSGITSFILKPWEHEDLLYEVTKAYNLYEVREHNRRYLQLIKNELSLAALLREEVSRAGDYDYQWCRAGCRFRISQDQGLRGVDVAQHMPIGKDSVLLFSAHLDSDGVRGSMIGGSILLRLLTSVVVHGGCREFDLAGIYSDLSAILSAISREVPEIMIRYTLGVLNRGNLTLQYTGNGFPPWLVLRQEGFGEIEPDQTHPGRIKTVKVESGDLIAVASPGVLEAMREEGETRPVRLLAQRLRESIGTESLSERAEALITCGDTPDVPTELTVMLMQVADGE